jgi:hypothetical protein
MMINFKTSNNLKRLTTAKTLLAAALLLTLTSCLKNDNDYIPQQVAAVSIFHASPGTQAFNFITDRGTGSGPFTFSQRTFYNLYAAGLRRISIRKVGGTQDTLRTGSVNLEADKFYSIYVVDAAPNPNFLIIKDSLSNPTAGKAKVRFINLSPDAGSLSLTTATDSLIFNTTAYKVHTPFSEISGNRTYTFKIKNNGTDKAIKQNVEIKTGRVYTIWAKGIDNTTNDTLKTAIQVSEHLSDY